MSENNDLLELSDLEANIKSHWTKIKEYIEAKGSPVFIWEARTHLEFIKRDIKLVESIFKKLHSNSIIDEKQFNKVIQGITILISHLDNIEGTEEWIQKAQHYLQKIISDVEIEKLEIEKMLQRRKFLKLGLVGLGTLALSQRGDSRLISFEEALQNPNLRQKYIAQLIERIGKPNYVEFVVYDHDRSRIRKDYITRALNKEYEFFDLPFELKYDEVKDIRKFLGIKESPHTIKELLKEKVKQKVIPGDVLLEELLKTQQGRQFLTEILKMVFQRRFPDTEAYGITLSKIPGGGQKQISRIYLFSNLFRKECVISNDKIIMELPPTEVGVIATIKHEYWHAKQNYEGLKLNNVFVRDKIKTYVGIELIIETDAYLNGSLTYLKQFGIKHPEYLRDVLNLISPIRDFEEYENIKFSEDERKLIDLQLAKLEPLHRLLISVFGHVNLELKKC